MGGADGADGADGAAATAVLASALVFRAALGSVNPATVALSCDARTDSFDIEAAVAVVAFPVCSPISFSLVVRRVTSAAEPACCRAEPEMFCTRFAI